MVRDCDTLALVLLFSFALPFEASAQPLDAPTAEPAVVSDDAASGAATVSALIGDPRFPELGGAVMADLSHSFSSWFRLGGAFGAAIISNPDGTRSQVTMPLAVSGTFVIADALEVRLRVGVWGGATDQGLTGGAWGSFGAFVRAGIGGRAAFVLGIDLILQSGTRTSLPILAPSFGVSWGPS